MHGACDQHHLRALGDRLGGDGEAHLAAAAVPDETHRIDVLVGGTGTHHDTAPDQAIHLTAAQFFALLKGEHHARLLCSCHTTLAGPELERHVEATVDMFLRAYGPGRR